MGKEQRVLETMSPTYGKDIATYQTLVIEAADDATSSM
jgi:hypothetical protein